MNKLRNLGTRVRAWGIGRASRQLLVEMWLPLLFALFWTIYNLAEVAPSGWTARGFINVFGPTFFFAAWLISQWLRVRKQQRVEDDLGGIARRLGQTLDALDEKTRHLEGLITGGESHCYIRPNLRSDGLPVEFFAIHNGKHPVYDTQIRVVDVEEITFSTANPGAMSGALVGRIASIPLLLPGHSIRLTLPPFQMTGLTRRFNIFLTARNGSFTQLLRSKPLGQGGWASAIKILRGSEVLFEQIDSEYPRQPNGEIDWDA